MTAFLIIFQLGAAAFVGYRITNGRMDTILGAAILAFLGFRIAIGRGVPLFTLNTGDACDIGTLIFLVICYCREGVTA